MGGFFEGCVIMGVAKWSKKLASFFRECSRESLGFEPSHGTPAGCGLTVDGGLPAVSDTTQSLGWQWSTGDGDVTSAIIMPAYIQKAHSLLTTFGGYGTTFTF